MQAVIDQVTQVYHKVNPAIILNAIKAKITDEADQVLEMYNTTDSWDDIKNTLILHFADKRDEHALIRDLHNLSQRNDSVEIFFAKLSDIVNALKNWTKLNNPDQAKFKIPWYDSMALAVFISNLREPLGSHIRSMRPSDLPTARTYCMTEQNLNNLKNKAMVPFKPLPPKPLHYNNNNLYRPQLNHYHYPPKPTPNWNNQYVPPNISHRPAFQNNKGPNPYYNHRPFAPQPNRILPKQEPMDTSSYPQAPKPPQFQNTFKHAFPIGQQNKYRVKELFNMERQQQHQYIDEVYDPTIEVEHPTESMEQYDNQYQEESYPETDELDFHQLVSETPDT